MKKIATLLCALLVSASALADETIVMVRHAEKPEAGLGQLDCQGLNRSMNLPPVLIGKYGRADYIFAPNPSELKDDHGTQYSYVRPLATIEPTAIGLGKPVNVQYGFKDIKGLEKELLSAQYQNSIVFVAWEHHYIEDMVKDMLTQAKQDSSMVPVWDDKDFDSIYVLHIKYDAQGNVQMSFSHDQQNLKHLSNNCIQMYKMLD
jgi:hypothetical protein